MRDTDLLGRKHAGFTEGRPWLPLNPEASTAHCERQQNDPALFGTGLGT